MINKETMLNLLAEEFGVTIDWEYTNVDTGPINTKEDLSDVLTDEQLIEFGGRVSSIVLCTPYVGGGEVCECSECICDDDKCNGGGSSGGCH